MGCGCYVTKPHLATAPQLQVWYPASLAPGLYHSPGSDPSPKQSSRDLKLRHELPRMLQGADATLSVLCHACGDS